MTEILPNSAKQKVSINRRFSKFESKYFRDLENIVEKISVILFFEQKLKKYVTKISS